MSKWFGIVSFAPTLVITEWECCFALHTQLLFSQLRGVLDFVLPYTIQYIQQPDTPYAPPYRFRWRLRKPASHMLLDLRSDEVDVGGPVEAF